MSLQNRMDAPTAGLATVKIPIGVASSMKAVELIPDVGFDELPLVPSLAVNDHDRILLASRSQESQDVVMKPVTTPGTFVKL
jgi:hypothetical protein